MSSICTANFKSMPSVPAMARNTEKTQRWNLQRKIQSFLQPVGAERTEIHKFVQTGSKRCDLFIVGGLLRDLLIHGRRKFSSDIDLVVNQISPNDFDIWMSEFRGVPNRFGGYSINVGPAKFDLWHLERTWAHVAGHHHVQQPKDLHQTTFFDWDCILYSVGNSSIIADVGYFGRVRSKILDIRLAQNPNPLGNAVRALRYACKYEARFSSQLVSHVAKEMRIHGWDRLVSYEARSFHTRYLQMINGELLYRRLTEHERDVPDHAFQAATTTEQLAFSNQALDG